MATNLDIGNHLNEQQMLMLRLFKNPLPEEDFLLMRQLAVKLLSKKLDDVITAWEEEKAINEKDYKDLAEGHFRSKP